MKTKIAGREKRQQGFTLLEVIVAGAIISAAMLAILPLLIQAYSIDKATAYKIKAQALTAQKLDDLISLSSTTNVDASGNLICDGPAVAYSDVTDLETGLPTIPTVVTALTRTWQINKITPTPPATTYLCQIIVTTSFTYQGQTKSFQLVSERGKQ